MTTQNNPSNPSNPPTNSSDENKSESESENKNENTDPFNILLEALESLLLGWLTSAEQQAEPEPEPEPEPEQEPTPTGRSRTRWTNKDNPLRDNSPQTEGKTNPFNPFSTCSNPNCILCAPSSLTLSKFLSTFDQPAEPAEPAESSQPDYSFLDRAISSLFGVEHEKHSQFWGLVDPMLPPVGSLPYTKLLRTRLPHAESLLHEKVNMALGEVSACWDNLLGAGEFLSSRASGISTQLMDDILEITQLGEPTLGCATTDELLTELRSRAETNGTINYRTVGNR